MINVSRKNKIKIKRTLKMFTYSKLLQYNVTTIHTWNIA
jgi:hypothetical protein